MITSNQLLQEFESATNAYVRIVSSLSQEELNTVPYEGSWTVAQITEHIFKSDNAVLKALYGPVQTTNRPADEGVENLKSIFLNYTTKLKSPEFIIPTDVKHDKEQLITAFKGVRELISKAIKTLDLTVTCSMPVFGEPTRLELISFVIFHTQRHTNQVQHIFEKLIHA